MNEPMWGEKRVDGSTGGVDMYIPYNITVEQFQKRYRQVRRRLSFQSSIGILDANDGEAWGDALESDLSYEFGDGDGQWVTIYDGVENPGGSDAPNDIGTLGWL